ncbi:hypothetical protein BGZ60DRAFT_180250 [Tricladium varicosporioides]|nr:hypothetical protein BGZ60DRAFT_180250 [Hymenoscyphus varicosporioides]
MTEFLDMDGNSPSDLADLVVNEKYDAPWILRPDYFQKYHDKIVLEPKPVMRLQYHCSSCPHGIHLKKDAGDLKDNDEDRTSRPPPPDLFLGIAGFIPALPLQEKDEFILHEMWRDQMCQHCVFSDGDDSAISITYARGSLLAGEDSDSSVFHQDLFELAKQILTALTQLVRSIAELQLCDLLCDSLPIIIKPRNELNDMIEVTDIKISEIGLLLQSLETGVSAWQIWNELAQEQAQGPSTTNSPFNIVERVGTVTLLGPSRAAMPLLAIPGTEASLVGKGIYDRVMSSSSSKLIRGETAWHDVSAFVARIFYKLHLLGTSSCSQFFFGSSHTPIFKKNPLVEILHYAASCAQVLCLGLQSFVQAHTGMPRFSFLDHDLTTIRLMGAGVTRRTIVAHLQNLTCFNNMTKGPVLVFQAGHLLDIVSPDAKSSLEKKPCDLVSSLENVVNIWGDAKVNYQGLGADGKRPHINNLWIAGGLLHPSKVALNLWHWTPARELLGQQPHPMIVKKPTELPLSIRKLSWKQPHPMIVPPSARRIEPLSVPWNEKVRIGAVFINPDCPLSKVDGQEVLQTIVEPFVEPLHTFPSFWTAEARNLGMQSGQYVVIQANVEYKKNAARTIKQALIDGDNYYLLPRLGYPWGIRACLCTGLVERVTLQEIISPYMISRIQSPTYSKNEQEQLKRLETEQEITSAFETGDLTQWFKQLPPDLCMPAWKLVREILSDLGYTGVDKEEMLRLAWLRPNKAIECLKIPCKGGNFWASMLADSSDWNSVAFASVTHQCLNTSSEFHECQRQIPPAYDPEQVFRLCTRMQAKGIDYNSRAIEGEFTLKPKSSYWVGAKELLLVAKASDDGGIIKLNVKPSIIGTRMFRRLNKRTELRETTNPESVECLVVTEDEAAIEDTKKAEKPSIPITRVTQSSSQSSLPVRQLLSPQRRA